MNRIRSLLLAVALVSPSVIVACVVPAQQGVSGATAQGGVYVNGAFVSPDQIRQMGGNPDAIPAGSYWYDATSGLYGAMGGGALGVTAAGLPFAAMPAGVSGSNMTGILVNGREITVPEAQYLMGLVGAQIPPGRYFIDAQGNAGQEGGPPQANLYQLARARGGGGGGGAGYIGTSDGSGGGYYDPSTGDGYFSFTDEHGRTYDTDSTTHTDPEGYDSPSGDE